MSSVHWKPVSIGIIVGAILTLVGIAFFRQQHPAPIQIIPAVIPSPAATPPPEPIRVFINGAIDQPGVYELPVEGRVGDLVEMAGGFSDAAVSASVNLAAPLSDGAQVFIPDTEMETTPLTQVESNVIVIDAPAIVPRPGRDQPSDTTLININSATVEQLKEIPGVGASTADKIITYREENGNFDTIEDIMNVSGIGEGKFEKMQAVITVQ